MGQKHRDFCRRHAISPEFSGNHQDLGIASKQGRESFYAVVLRLAWHCDHTIRSIAKVLEDFDTDENGAIGRAEFIELYETVKSGRDAELFAEE